MTINKCNRSLLVAMCTVGVASAAVAEELPNGIYTIADVTIGTTTVADIERVYGRADAIRQSRQDGSDINYCYKFILKKSTAVYLTFFTGPMGGFEGITGYSLTAKQPSWSCRMSDLNAGQLATRNGVHIGQSISDFRLATKVAFKQNGGTYSYDQQSSRPMTELERGRSLQPVEPDAYFDITTHIRASFNRGRLTAIRVEKVESD